MAECQAGNDYAGDPCGHRPGPAKQREYERKYQNTPQGKVNQKERDARRQANPQRAAKRKEYERKRQATPHYKAWLKEYNATPHRKAKRK